MEGKPLDVMETFVTQLGHELVYVLRPDLWRL